VPNELRVNLVPGDYAVVRTSGLVGWAIRVFTRSKWNHAFLYLGNGRIIESRAAGATIRELKEYGPQNLTAINWGDRIDEDTRHRIILFGEKLQGVPYGFLDIAVLAFACFGIRNRWIDARINRQDRLICSQLVDKAYAAAGFQLFNDGRMPSEVTPGDLGERPQVDFIDY
jgi:hypothetical protein